MLARHEPYQRCELTAAPKGLCVTDGCHHRTDRDRPDPWNLLKPSAELALPMPGFDLRLQIHNMRIQHLQVVDKPIDKHSKRSRQLITRILNELGDATCDMADALQHDEPKLREQASNLVACAVRALMNP